MKERKDKVTFTTTTAMSSPSTSFEHLEVSNYNNIWDLWQKIQPTPYVVSPSLPSTTITSPKIMNGNKKLNWIPKAEDIREETLFASEEYSIAEDVIRKAVMAWEFGVPLSSRLSECKLLIEHLKDQWYNIGSWSLVTSIKNWIYISWDGVEHNMTYEKLPEKVDSEVDYPF